jgi:quinol monooxygenase YgiN
MWYRKLDGGRRPASVALSKRNFKMIHVLAIITAKPGKRAELLEIFQANVPAVHAEDGCIEYTAVIDIENAEPAFGADTFVVVEKWESLAALKAHAASSHMRAYSEKTKDLLSAAAVHVLEPA